MLVDLLQQNCEKRVPNKTTEKVLLRSKENVQHDFHTMTELINNVDLEYT